MHINNKSIENCEKKLGYEVLDSQTLSYQKEPEIHLNNFHSTRLTSSINLFQ